MIWSDDDDKFLENNFKIKSVVVLAESLKRSRYSILWRARKLGLAESNEWQQYEDEILSDLWSGSSIEEISEVLISRSKSSVSRRAKKIGLQKRKRWTKKEDNILFLHAGEESIEWIANALSRSKGSVRDRLTRCGLKTSQGKRTIREAADILGTTPTTVLRRIKKARIKIKKVDGRLDITDENIVRLAKNLMNKPNLRGQNNVSMRKLKEVIAEYGGDVKMKKRRKYGTGGKKK